MEAAALAVMPVRSEGLSAAAVCKLLHPAADAAAGAWRNYHGSIYARLPFVHSCTADAAVQEDLWRADERQERAARNLVQSFTFGAPGVGGGHRHARRGRPSARGFLLSRAAVV